MRDDRLDTPVAKTIVIPSSQQLPGHAKGHQPNAPTISMKDVLFTLRRWWWRCTLVAVPLAIAAAATVWFTFVPMYEATSLLEIKGQPPSDGQQIGVRATSPRNDRAVWGFDDFRITAPEAPRTQ